MKIVIVGAGNVGYTLASYLLEEGHDIIMVEADDERAERAEANLDVLVIRGNGARPAVLEKAGIKPGTDVDVLVACTGVDESNILSCLIAKRCGVKRVIARSRNLEFTDDSFWAESLGIDYMISPERSIAKEIEHVLRVKPSTHYLELADGRALLYSMKVSPTSPMVSKSLREVGKANPGLRVNVVLVEREGEEIVPNGDTVVQADDILYLVTTREHVKRLEELFLGGKSKPLRRVVIVGGGKIGYRLAMQLESSREDVEIKIIEKNPDKCMRISQELSKTMVINGDGTDLATLEAEEVGEADAFITTTQHDEINLLSAALAHSLGTEKCIAVVRKMDYMKLVDHLPLSSIINFYESMVSSILSEIRSFSGRASRVSILEDVESSVLEIEAEAGAPAVGVPLREAKLPKGVILACILKKSGEIVIPRGEDVVEPGDRVTTFVSDELLDRARQLFCRRAKAA